MSVTGSVSRTESLTVFQGHQPCRIDAESQNQTPGEHRVWQLTPGSFNKTFLSAPDTQPGYFCAYLNTGTSEYFNVPDGRTTAGRQVPFLAGDTIGISGPSSTAGFTSLTDTFAGTASSPGETLWVFESYLPCGRSAQVEYQQALAGASFPLGQGSFSKSPSSFSSSTFPSGSFWQCAYLQLGAPANGLPTGPTLASASYLITVTDALTISGPTHTALHTSVTNTFSGAAISPGEYLWSFESYAPCDSTAQAEKVDPNEWGVGNQPVTQGPFSVSRSSPGNATDPSMSFYRCAYLQSGPPDISGNPTGSTLAAASYFISVP